MIEFAEIDWSLTRTLRHNGYPNVAEYSFQEARAEAASIYAAFREWAATEVHVEQPDPDISAVMIQLAMIKGAAEGQANLSEAIINRIAEDWDTTADVTVTAGMASEPMFALFKEAHEGLRQMGYRFASVEQEQWVYDRYFAIPEADRLDYDLSSDAGRALNHMDRLLMSIVQARMAGVRYLTMACENTLDITSRLQNHGLMKKTHVLSRRMLLMKAYIMSADSRGTLLSLNFEDSGVPA